MSGRSRFDELRQRVGRRGCALLFFALLDVVFAWALLSAPLELPVYAFLAKLLPLWVWALPWAAVGVLCAVHVPLTADRLAFAAASWLKVGWAALHLTGWALCEIPRGWVAATVWLAFAGFVQVIAGWTEPPRRGS